MTGDADQHLRVGKVAVLDPQRLHDPFDQCADIVARGIRPGHQTQGPFVVHGEMAGRHDQRHVQPRHPAPQLGLPPGLARLRPAAQGRAAGGLEQRRHAHGPVADRRAMLCSKVKEAPVAQVGPVRRGPEIVVDEGCGHLSALS